MSALVRVFSLLLVAALVACDPPAGTPSPAGTTDAVAADAGADASADAGADTKTVDVAPPPPFAVHEWGALTSFQSSLGQHLPGVQRNEEQLPDFVHFRDVGPQGAGAAETLTEGVVHKVQAAALFVYADAAFDLTVQLGTPEGLVTADRPRATQLLPAASAQLPLQGGQATWQLRVEPGPGDLPAVPGHSLWAKLRQVQAATVQRASAQADAEPERFVFHRGLLRLQAPVRVTSKPVDFSPTDETTVHNDGDADIPAAFWLHIHAGGGLVKALGKVPKGGMVVGSVTPKENNPAIFEPAAQKMLQDALIDAGLQADEAKAAVATWSHNWLLTPGKRVVYVVPRPWVDTWLPQTVTPAPQAHVRAWVARVELLTGPEEQALQAQIEQAAASGDLGVVDELGFFAEPRLWRARELLTGEAERAFVDELIAAARKLQ